MVNSKIAYRALVSIVGIGVLEVSVFFPIPMVWATKSRTDQSSESQPDGTLRKGNAT